VADVVIAVVDVAIAAIDSRRRHGVTGVVIVGIVGRGKREEELVLV